MDVALKEVRLPPSSSQAENRKRLAYAVREARNAAKLRDHPNIVAVHDVVVEDEIPWMVMRLVDGDSLEQRLTSGGPLPARRTAEIATALLEALQAAHAAGIVHRDVKPANVMLTTDGHVLLTDFGISVRQADTALTTIGAVIGSAEYMAPERMNDIDVPAGDLFSLGVTLYQATEGVSPFRRKSPTATLAAVAMHEPPTPQRAGTLAPLIKALLTKDPGERPSIETALTMVHERTPTNPKTTKVLPKERQGKPGNSVGKRQQQTPGNKSRKGQKKKPGNAAKKDDGTSCAVFLALLIGSAAVPFGYRDLAPLAMSQALVLGVLQVFFTSPLIGWIVSVLLVRVEVKKRSRISVGSGVLSAVLILLISAAQAA